LDPDAIRRPPPSPGDRYLPQALAGSPTVTGDRGVIRSRWLPVRGSQPVTA
jgi:hypothetical protein